MVVGLLKLALPASLGLYLKWPQTESKAQNFDYFGLLSSYNY